MHSLEESPVGPTIKMADLKGQFWDFSVNTNAVTFEKYLLSRLPPPHNEIEQMRANLLQELRIQYNDLCRQKEGISAPKESFNRWLLERKVFDKGTDPMLPSKCSPEVSPSMKREIMSDISNGKASPERPHLSAEVQSSVEGICTEMYHMSCKIVKKLRDKHWELLKKHQIEEPPPLTRPPRDNKILCHSVYAIVRSPRLPTVNIHDEGSTKCLCYKGEMMKINTAHFRKLDLLYRFHNDDDGPGYNYLPRVWCLIRRYHTLFGVGQYEGLSLQGALPVNIFKSLHDNFGVTFECFASPLNCYFKQYCSAFADTDCYFGSRGPVLNFYPVSGSFEANPPFSEELMEAMVAHFEILLANTTDPLSFIIFIPEWKNPPTAALVNMEKSRFKRRRETVPAFKHEYRKGGQHSCADNDVNYRAVHGTAIFFLQNEAGFWKWTPTDKKIKILMDAYRL